MNEEIDVCPVCGSIPEIYSYRDIDGDTFWNIKCVKCKCSLSKNYDYYDEMIYDWNNMKTYKSKE